MSLKNKLFKEMFKMSPAAAQQASTKAPSHKLSCRTKPDATKQKLKNLDPAHGQLWATGSVRNGNETASPAPRVAIFLSTFARGRTCSTDYLQKHSLCGCTVDSAKT